MSAPTDKERALILLVIRDRALKRVKELKFETEAEEKAFLRGVTYATFQMLKHITTTTK